MPARLPRRRRWSASPSSAAIIRFLYGRPLETLLATWGLSLILQQAVRSHLRRRPTGRSATRPGCRAPFDVGSLTITYNRLWIIVFALAGLRRAASCVLKRTPFGLQMRAVTQNRRMAASMGIRTPWVDALHLRARLRHRRHRRRGAVADRQRLAQSRPGLHHRQLHGRGVRRRRQSLGHAGRRASRSASPTSSSSPMPARCSARSSCWSSSSCSSRSARAACSRSRAGRWKHDHRDASCRGLGPPRRCHDRVILLAVAIIVPLLQSRACRRRARCMCRPTSVALFGKYL